VRRYLVFVLALAACSGGDRSDIPSTGTASSTLGHGPDALLLRVPRRGGIARVTSYPNLDSTVWTASASSPSLDHVLAFDPEAGLVAVEDDRGMPGWIDLRTGSVTLPSRSKVHGSASVDGSTIYAVGSDGSITRFTPTGNWVFKPPTPAQEVFPQANGTIVILGGRGEGARLWRMHPPENKILDSLPLADGTTGASAPLADRIYVATTARTLIGVRARRLTQTKKLEFDHTITGIASTPSGNRFYVVTDSGTAVSVIDQYQDRVSATIELPGRARDVRVDPFGRFLLVRASRGDSLWVVSVGSDRVLGAIKSIWRGDLPFVAPDGAIAVSDGRDLMFLEPTTLRELRRVDGGASDFWYPFLWNGLRARAAILDKPVEVAADSTPPTTQPVVPPTKDTVAAQPTPPAPIRVDSAKIGFSVSFAALLNEAAAQSQAAKISVEGKTARVVVGTSSGVTVYRVVLGPYPSREEADRIGRASGLSYYVFVGSP
jgi:hypothetical protein